MTIFKNMQKCIKIQTPREYSQLASIKPLTGPYAGAPPAWLLRELLLWGSPRKKEQKG